MLKDHPDRVLECLPLMDRLQSKYSILTMGRAVAMMASSGRSSTASTAQPKADTTYGGPLIEEIDSSPAPAVIERSATSPSAAPGHTKAAADRSRHAMSPPLQQGGCWGQKKMVQAKLGRWSCLCLR